MFQVKIMYSKVFFSKGTEVLPAMCIKSKHILSVLYCISRYIIVLMDSNVISILVLKMIDVNLVNIAVRHVECSGIKMKMQRTGSIILCCFMLLK